MYKVSNFIFAVAMFAAALTSCNKDKNNDPETELSALPATLTFAAAGESKTFDVKSNVAWTVSGQPDWLDVTPLIGVNDATVTVTAIANTGGARTTELTIATVGVDPVTVTIEQEAKPAPPDGSGSGATSDPYIVASATTLKKAGSGADGWALDKHYRQTASINMIGASWTPIGNEDTPFKGSYDGGGYSIKNLTINGTHDCGLFGVIEWGAVRNVALTDLTINATEYCIGGIVGDNKGGTIENCYVTGEITGSYYIGGVAGRNFYFLKTGDITVTRSSIKNCYTTCNLTSTGGQSGYQSYTGGIAGLNYGNIERCYATGEIKGNYGVCGIAGRMEDNSSITNCAALSPKVSGTMNTYDNIPAVVARISYIPAYATATAKFESNHARSDMELKHGVGSGTDAPLEKGADKKDGADFTYSDLLGATGKVWWENAVNFTSANWVFATGSLPKLKTTTGSTFADKQ